jgi:hypothetical protein
MASPFNSTGSVRLHRFLKLEIIDGAPETSDDRFANTWFALAPSTVLVGRIVPESL